VTTPSRPVDTLGGGFTLEPPTHDPLSDTRIRHLLTRYATLAHATLAEPGPHLLELRVPPGDRPHFGGRDRVLVAFSLGALESTPDAEMAVIGSPFVEQLLQAIRARGARLSLGLVAPTFAADATAATLDVPIVNGTASTPSVRVARHAAGRLLARVLFRAGAVVEEHLVESGWFDFTTGAPLSPDLVECCSALESAAAVPAPSTVVSDAVISASKPVDELVTLMLGDLHRRLAQQFDRLESEAERALAAELARIDGYYRSLLSEASVKPDDQRTFTAEHERRAAEEKRRHQVRAVVHPLQVVESELLTQRAEWTIATPKGRSGRLAAQRALSGRGAWAMSCPTCATVPEKLLVCKTNHVVCGACGFSCSICTEEFCRDHGLSACHVDAAPACTEHSRTCVSCRRAHCTAHEGVCVEGEHEACSACLAECAICAQSVCATHAAMTSDESPRGARRLCRGCTVYCASGRSEAVGRDEVERCASCKRSVCSNHRAVCAVDQQVHCSAHLRRSDRTRRLLCETHRTTCAYEPDAVLASDEVGACATCGSTVCDQHAAACVEDGQRHCRRHLSPLKDRPGVYACEAHRTVCRVDGVVFSVGGTSECPVCAQRVCAPHTRKCGNCGRSVCLNDWHPGGTACVTCHQLQEWNDPSDSAIAAAVEARGGLKARARGWRVARDATHSVVELAHGFRRRTVLAVRHGDSRAEHVMTHTVLGSNRKR
jgi:hypothetical protein